MACQTVRPISSTSLSVTYAPTAEPSVAFYRYLLPPIIFYAGISVKKKQFFRNFASIASFGVLGTYIAFAVIACVLYVFSKLPNILNFSVSNYSAILSAGPLLHFESWACSSQAACCVVSV